MANIPPAVLALVERVPAEDIALAVLRAGLAGVPVVSQISKSQAFPVVLVRRLPTFSDAGGDERFVEANDISLHAFVEDPDGDRDAGLLSEACRVLLRDAWLGHWYNPALGSISRMETLAPPRRVPDWATASGPVQYADLPSNVWRYEGRYRLAVRKPTNPPHPLP